MKLKRIIFRFLKITGWIILSITGLLFIVSLLIQLPSVQNFIISKATSYLENEIGTKVSVDRIRFSFPKKVFLDGLYLEDQQKDTLLYLGHLGIDTDLFGIARKKISLNKVELLDFTGYASRPKNDSAFNFTYIINAFAADTTSSTDTSSSSWKISIGSVELNRIKIQYDDSLQGDHVSLDVGKLSMDMQEFNPERSIYRVGEITLSEVNADIIQSGDSSQISPDQSAVEVDQADTKLTLGVNEVNLHSINVSYMNTLTGDAVKLDLQESQLQADKLDLLNQEILLERFYLNNAFASYHKLKRTHSPKMTTGPDTTGLERPSKPWLIALNKLDVQHSSIQYYDFNEPAMKNAIDFNHTWLTRLNVDAQNLKVNGNTFQGNVRNISFQEKSGFKLTSLQTEFDVADSSARLSKFILQTPHSEIDLRAEADFFSMSSLNETYPQAMVDLLLKNTTIAFSDIKFLSPGFADSLALSIPDTAEVRLEVSLQGKVNDLTVERCILQTLNHSIVDIAGNIEGLPDVQNAIAHLTINKVATQRRDLEIILPDSLTQETILLPDWVTLEGDFHGSLVKPDMNATISSSMGLINLTAKANFDSANSLPTYRGKVEIENFEIGKLLRQQDAMGDLSMNASVTGSGLRMDEISAKVNLTVLSFAYNGYRYKDFVLQGSVDKYLFSGKAAIEDKNLTMKLSADLDYNEEVADYKLTLDLKNADFKELHLSQLPLKARGTLDVDLATSDFRSINGNVTLRDVGIFNDKVLYVVDSLFFASIDQKGRSEISIRSDIVSGDFKGSINLFSLPKVMGEHFNRYLVPKEGIQAVPDSTHQHFEFDLTILDTELLTNVIFPGLTSFEPGEIKGEFDSRENHLDINFEVTDVAYTTLSLDSAVLNINSDEDDLTYSIRLKQVAMDTLRIHALALTGDLANDTLKTVFTILDSLDERKYVLGGSLSRKNDSIQFSLDPERLVFNYESWSIPEENILKFSEGMPVTEHMQLSKDNEQISISTSTGRDSTVLFQFKDLNLTSITSLVSGITPVKGILNGNLSLGTSEADYLQSNLAIEDLVLLEQPWGTLTLDLERQSTSPYQIGLAVKGENVDMEVDGQYQDTSSDATFDLTATIEKFNLAAIEPFTFGQLKNSKGKLHGRINVSGKAADPKIAGNLLFDKIEFLSTYTNSRFLIHDETLVLKSTGLSFNGFDIEDSKGNKSTIDGTIEATNFPEFGLDLQLTANNFQLLNTTEDDNDLFYGKIGLNTQAKISGTSNRPEINMEVSLSEESSLTYVVPQSELGVLEQEGIVRFVDNDIKGDPFLASIKPEDTVQTAFTGLDLTANIELSDDEIFNIVIDPVTGDMLSVRGNTTLTLVIDPTGDMQLTGRYEVTEGTYNLTFYKLVKREFEIQEGSSIVWSGDPYNAALDLRAVYHVETAPIELVSNQLTTSGQQELNQYKQRLPFLVYIDIKGELLAPEISFRLDMPEERRNAFGGNVYAKIEDLNSREADRNKQVFALLVLRRFISDDPFDNETGGFESGARSSVSRLLTEQLNRMSENIKGVEVSFEVESYEDYSTGSSEGMTQLELGLSKSLLNDRLVVKVSGNVGLEGEAANQNSFSDFIGDLAVEYKLTEDGRFRITGFRNSNYDMIDGELTETGAGLIYIRDYNTLRELFKGDPKINNKNE